MAEPITIVLTFPVGASGSGEIPLTREQFTSSNGRLFTATVPSGSRITAQFFGLFAEGSVKKVTVSASTSNPRALASIESGSVASTIISLGGGPRALSFGPSQDLVFRLEGATRITIVANEMSEADEAASFASSRQPVTRISLRKSDGAGFSASGQTTPTLVWNENTKQLEAASVGAGSIPLGVLEPRADRRADGVSATVRVTGCDGTTVQVGVQDGYTGDYFFSQTIGRGERSLPVTLYEGDALAIESPAIRVGCPAVVADIAILPERVVPTLSSEPVTGTGSSAGVAGELPLGAFENLAVNHAGVNFEPSGIELWTHDHNGDSSDGFNGTGKGNKAIAGHAGSLIDLPLGDLTSLDLEYVNRTAGNTSELNTPYVNLTVDVGGGTIKIFVLAIHTNPLLAMLTKTAVGDPQENRFRLTWVGGRTLVVNSLAGVIPNVDLGGGWLEEVYLFADILAQYPDAKLVRAYAADNGLPKERISPPLMAVLGDSNYKQNSRALLERVRVNS